MLASLTLPGHERVVESIERAGLPFIAPEPVSIDDVYRDVRASAYVEQTPSQIAEGEASTARPNQVEWSTCKPLKSLMGPSCGIRR